MQDPLDSTRIHPEDRDLARKMATDALELDKEDVHGEHPSHVVALIIEDADNVCYEMAYVLYFYHGLHKDT